MAFTSKNIRGTLTLHTNHLKGLCDEVKILLEAPFVRGTNPASGTIYELECAKLRIDNKLSKIQGKVDEWAAKIEVQEDEAKRTSEETLFEQMLCTVDQEYEPIIRGASDCTDRLEVAIAHFKNSEADIGTPLFNQSSVQIPTTVVKLPVLQLPRFSGDPLEWDAFWTIFDANVHQQSMAGVTKFTYLNMQLDGLAKDTIAGLPVNETSYEEAVDLLKSRFQKSSASLVSSLYANLKRIKRSGGRIADKRRTYNMCEKTLRQLQSHGERLEDNHSLSFDILQKFPEPMIRDLYRHYKVGVKSDPKVLQAMIGRYLDEAEELGEALADLDISEGKTKGGQVDQAEAHRWSSMPPEPYFNARRMQTGQATTTRYGNQGSHFTSAMYTGGASASATGRQSNARPCVFCNGGHSDDNCQVYATVQARKQRLWDMGNCSLCTKPGHYRRDCRSWVRCNVCNLMGHPQSLCENRWKRTPSTYHQRADRSRTQRDAEYKTDDLANLIATSPTDCKDNESGNPTDEDTIQIQEQERTQTHTYLNQPKNGRREAMLLTAKVTVVNLETDRRVQARLVLDTGSHRSYIIDRLAKELEMEPLQAETLEVKGFAANTTTVHSNLVAFGIVERDGNLRRVEANTTPVISDCSVQPTIVSPKDWEVITAMGQSLADDVGGSDSSLDILVGADYFWDFVTGARLRTDTDLLLIPSTLGLLVAGKLVWAAVEEQKQKETPSFFCTVQPRNHIHGLEYVEEQAGKGTADIDHFFKLEVAGIDGDPVISDDQKAMDSYARSTRFVDDRVEVSFPWIEEKKCLLPTNEWLAKGRMRSLAKRLEQDPRLLIGYQATIDYQLEKGIIERVPQVEVKRPKHLVHYLPHHPVERPDHATTKVRIVFDASSKSKRSDLSLNECMYRGPVLLPNLVEVILRFRIHSVAIIADIEKAFLQMSLCPEDRDANRFFWFKDPNSLKIEGNTQVFRFRRVAFGMISCPFLLGATIARLLDEDGSVEAGKIKADMYVDNLITGTDSVEEAQILYQRAKSAFGRASMNLQEWNSNNKDVVAEIPEHDRMKAKRTQVLGLEWDCMETDSFGLSSKGWTKCTSVPSKRFILRKVAAIFDPMGFFQPVTLAAKLLLQELWERKCDWDSPLSDDLLCKWQRIEAGIEPIFTTRLPRFIGGLTRDSSLVVFTDASEKAYAAVAYVCTVSEAGISANLVYAKTRLAPSGTKVTLPRLELLGFTIGARMANFLRRSLGVKIKLYLFTDATTVLHWIRSTKKYSRFVTARLNEIKAVTDCEYRFVRSEDNPADLCTRGKTGMELQESSFWWHGPSWLSKSVNEWPTKLDLAVFTDKDIEAIEAEIPVTHASHTLVTVDRPRSDVLEGYISNVIQVADYSSMTRMFRVTALCLKFLKRMVCLKIADDKAVRCGLINRVGEGRVVDCQDTDVAKKVWVRAVQQEHYAQAIEAIHTKQKHGLVTQLNLDLDEDGLLRTYSRYGNADLPESTRNPILLPKKGLFAKLVVRSIHKAVGHFGGDGYTLAFVRREFWIPSGRQYVRKVLYGCAGCLKIKGPSYKQPPMPDWPVERVKKSIPFEAVGLDYFGPSTVRVGNQRVGFKTMGVHVCLFTCLTIRAVHLEVVLDAGGTEFLDALIRFVARRGVPKLIISDNAGQFQITKSLVQKAWFESITSHAVERYSSEKGIKWRFIAELAPWQGGFYERLVGLVKGAMRVVIGRRILSLSELMTLVIETEAVVNSRPLTYVHEDVNSKERILRPCDFLTGLPICHGISEEAIRSGEGLDGEGGKRLVAAWWQRKRYLEKLWRYWYDEYLLSLRERGGRSHRSQKNTVEGPPKVGEIVVVKNEDAPRGMWKMGRVKSLVVGSDGLVRSAHVVLGNGYVIRRACNHLYPLELYTGDEQATPQQQPPNPDDSPVHEQGDDALLPPHDIALSEDDYGLFTQDDLDRLQGFLDGVDDKLANAEEDDWDQSSSAVAWD